MVLHGAFCVFTLCEPGGTLMRALVLGATGFIGGHIARTAYEAGSEVHGLRRRPGAVGAVGDVPIIWHDGDLTDGDGLKAALKGCEVLFHAAGYYAYRERSIQHAVQQAAKEIRIVLEAARQAGVRRMIYTSSLTTIGSPPAGSSRLADEQDWYVPGSIKNAYFESKLIMEYEVLRAVLEGLPALILCPAAVFGPGDLKPTTGRLLLDLARGRFPVSVEVPTNIVDVRDVALAHVRGVTQGNPGERYIIGGHNMKLNDALHRAAEIIGVRPPAWVLDVHLADRLMQLGRLVRLPVPELTFALGHFQSLNSEKGQRTFGFTPRPFEETVRDTINWFREHGYL
jgi:dihydroflavonol-4-reductase